MGSTTNKRVHKRSQVVSAVRVSVIIFSFVVFLRLLTFAQGSLTAHTDVQGVLTSLADILPPELRPPNASTSQKGWGEWVIGHDRDIRTRLLRGDQDTLVNWLLFGTSFTRQPRAYFDPAETQDALRRRISLRTKDLISGLASANSDERIVFARQLLLRQGYRFDSAEEQARLERHLYAEVDRVVAERQQYMDREDAVPAADVIERIVAQSNLFQDRGLSLDTSILPGFAIEQALEAMKSQRLLAANEIRRVAVIGPGLDFADKNSGYDFYPVQTVQPFTTIDSLVRLGLASRAEDIELATFDISPHVNDHIRAMGERARGGAPYILRIPRDLGSPWTPPLVDYWKSLGDRIGSEMQLPKPLHALDEVELRGLEIRPQVAANVTPMNFNIVTDKWNGQPFDLVIATNVLVYYDTLDQALAFAGIEAMLRQGGFFITNNVVVELPVSRLRAIGVMAVQHSAEKVDRVFWYRRGN
ncbi:MAG TPA: hypothetical protein VFR18_13940 [Terriglobia bacterium]|nr:hypothetical protein [Terriglobia bacterium]